MLDHATQLRIKEAFNAGKVLVKSISPQGTPEWKQVLAVQRAEVWLEEILEVSTSRGVAILTAGHRVFLTPTSKVEAEKLRPGHESFGTSVTSVRRIPSRQFMYDLTAADWHNFVLHTSGLLVSNSPDRNYHFRPPAHEETVGQYNQVFGHIWLDEELQEYLQTSLDMIAAAPPYTPFSSVTSLVQSYPNWRTLLLNGAMMHAIFAMVLNWVADEFSYSVGGVSLDLEKSSKYESAYQAMSDRFDKQLELAKATVKIIKGLQQPKYGIGIRSSFGPHTGAGALTPRKFVGF